MQRYGPGQMEYESRMDFVYKRLKQIPSSSIQRELHAYQPQFTQQELAELVFRCTVKDPSVTALKQHGPWTRLCLSQSVMSILQVSCNSLIHDVIMTSTRVPELAIPIIQMLLQHDMLLLGLRLGNDSHDLPWQLAMKYKAPIPVVMMMVPPSEFSLWTNSPQELSPEQFAIAIFNNLRQRNVPDMLPHYRELCIRLGEHREQVEQIQEKLAQRQEQEAQLAELMAMLQQLPVLTTQAVDTATNKMLSDHINALMQPDKLNIIRSNGKLVGTCSQCLCAALWQAAVSHKFNYHGPLVKMYRVMKWQEYTNMGDLNKTHVQLLQDAIKGHYTALSHLLLNSDKTLLSKCNTPPLCLMMEKGAAVPMDLVAVLLELCHDHRQDGVDEIYKHKTAMGYAMQLGQHDLVEKLMPYSRVEHKFLAKAASTTAKTNARFTPLLYAIEVKQHVWVVALIHQAKKQFKRDAEKQFESTHAPSNASATQRLLQQIARAAQHKMQDWLDTTCGAGNPPAALARALEMETWDTATLLVTEQASPCKTCYRGAEESSGLHKAVELGRLDIVRVMAKQMAKDMHNSKEMQTICANKTPLLLAVAKQQFEIAEALVKAGADPWFACPQEDSDDISPAQSIVYAVSPGDKAAEQAGLRLMQLLVSKSGSATTADSVRSQSILTAGPAIMHQAINKSLLSIATLLMRQGVDIAQTHDNEAGISSPLLLLVAAAEEDEDPSSAKEMLREALVIWNVLQTTTAAHYSMHSDSQQRIVRWMVEHKASTITPFARSKQEQRRLVQQVIDAKSLTLLQVLVNELKMNCSGCYLHAIVEDAPLQLLTTLLKASHSIDQRHPVLKTYVIHKAVEANRGDLVEQLVQSKAQLQARDGNGNTALHLAVRCKEQSTQEQIVAALLKKDPSLLKELNTKGKTAADLVSHKKKLREWFEAFSSSVILEGREGDSQPSDHSDIDSEDEVADEAPVGEGVMLTRPDEALPAKQRRIESLIKQIPESLEAGAAAEAASVAAKKASESELPAAAKAQAQHEAMWTALEGKLPTELPVRDEGAEAQANVDNAPADADLQVLNEDDLVKSLVGLPWEFIINKAARQEWAGMDRQFRVLVAKRLQRIGEGFWGRDGGTERRLGDVRGLEVYRTLLTKSGRIVFEVAVDYSQTSHTWKEMIRLWVVTLDHDRYERELNNIAESHSKSIQARDNVKLKAVGVGGGDLHARVPKIYQAIDESIGDYEAALQALADANTEVREHFPAASASQDTYTLLKFYNLSTDLVKAVLRSYGEDTDIDFPFRVSPSEQTVIESDPDPPCSIVLVGRSGTGKTTCAVFRMWFRWLTFRHHSAEPFHQIFLTANPKLRSEVAKQFHKLRAAVLHDPEEAKRLEELSNQDYPILDQIPSDAFPLFWDSEHYLRAADATLAKPFFPRLEGGGLVHQEHAHNEDMGGIESLIDMDTGFSDGESDEEGNEEDGDDADNDKVTPQGSPTPKKGTLGPKLEADYDFFVDTMWLAITTKAERQNLTPALIWQEICSFWKGSAEAMDCENGKLSLDQYLEVGRKRAPNFNADTRQLVFPIFERYEREKVRLNRYDHMDLLFHIYSSVKANGYKGTIIHNIYRDEVQDFPQAELLIDLRMMADPNGLFCCGDPCQTIARGIVFRFADICTLFHQESQRRKAAGGQAAAMHVGQPKKPWFLPTNYRTHAGILGAAAAVVDVLRDQFPQHVDNLPREKAFFKGPPPLLLSSVNPDDLTFLLLGSDPKTSQVEFGAHQVILGRTKESLDSLPQHLRDSNVIKMLVGQSKGLEFDDVFLWDFFNGSPADWRPLSNFTNKLEEIERTQGPKKLPAGTPLVNVEVDAADKGFLRPARSEEPDVLLCEEFKHLYTGITRAKNNVIVFDRNKAKRAPFFHYLRRLGLAQHTSKSVMEEHSDDSRYVLTQGKNTPEDWVQRGNNFMDCRLFELAAHCYKVAKDSVRFTVANAYASALDVKKNRKGRLTSEQRLQCFKAGHDLMTAASWADQAPVPVLVAQRKKWLAVAASMLNTSKDSSPLAARLYITLGDLKNAVIAYLRCGELASAAQTCETLATANSAEAEHWLQEAIKHYRKAKQPVESFDLLLRHPQLQATLSGQKLDELAGIAMTAYSQKGEHSKAISACRKIRSAASRHQKLASLGYWEELANNTQDNSKAAEILASHGHIEAAVKRLVNPYQITVLQGRKQELSATDQAVLKQIHTYCASMGTTWAQQQMAVVVDAFAVEDPFFGHGHLIKGRLLQAQGQPADALEYFKLALQAYRNRQSQKACDCLIATAAIIGLMSEEDLNTAWPMLSQQDSDKQTDKIPCANEYIAWTLEAGQAAQDMLSALLCKPSDRLVPRYRNSLLELESHFEVRGLPGPEKDLSYNEHSAAFNQAKQDVTGTKEEQTIKQAASGRVPRRLAEQAMALQLAKLAIPILGKACKAVVKTILHPSEEQSKLQKLTVDVKEVLAGLNSFALAAKMVDLDTGISNAVAQLHMNLSKVAGLAPAEKDGIQAAIGASIVQLQLPLACVDGITSQAFGQFRKVAQQARLRVNQMAGMSSLGKSWSQLLRAYTAVGGGENENAGFAAWMLASVLLGEPHPLRLAVERLSGTQRRAKGMLKMDRLAKLDCELLSKASQAFARGTPESACQAMLFYMERCRVLAKQSEQQQAHQLSLEAHLFLLETVASLVLLGLGRLIFLPDHYLEMLEQSPLLGRKSGPHERPRVNNLRKQWQEKVKLESTITMLTRVVRLLHNLVTTIISDAAALAVRPHITSAVKLSPDDTSEEEVQSDQQRAAARVIVLAVTLLTACDVHNTGSKADRVPADLGTAAWKVIHLAQACIQNEEFQRHVKGYEAALTIGDALKEQLSLTYRLTSGLTQVKAHGHVAFDRLPSQAPGLKSKDPEVTLLLQLAKAPCMPRRKDAAAKLTGSVRQLLLMPDASEVASFSEGTGTSAKKAAAALVIQEAYRQYRHRALCKAKLKFLRTSNLWRQAVRRWRHQVQATLASRRDAAAVAAMEAQRRQHEADAQRRLAWVDEALLQRTLVDTTCPVCDKDAEKLYKAAQKELAGDEGESDEEEDDEPSKSAANNPFAALSGLGNAVNAPEFIPHRHKGYHLESLSAFQAYKQYYTDQVVPVMTEQKNMEVAFTAAEPRAATDAEFQNTLSEERFKLDESLQQIQSCMKQFEKEHAWQHHLLQLPALLATHSRYLQTIKAWLESGESPGTVPQEEQTVHTPRQASGAVAQSPLKAEASWHSPDKEVAREFDMYDDEDYFDNAEFEPVQSKKQKKAARKGKGKGKQQW